MSLRVENLKFAYGSEPVLQDLEMTASRGKVTAVIGPNASGKSTLFKCIAGMLEPKGRVLFDDGKISDLEGKTSKFIAYQTQEFSVSAALTVFETVLLGRLHSMSLRVREEDREIVSAVLVDLEIKDLALDYLDELSGGQKQMVSIAQSLVRKPEVLLLDEPTNNLDLQRQLEVLEKMRGITKKRGIVSLIAMHDVNLAARYADELHVLNGGKICESGPPASVLTPTLLRDVYGVNATVSTMEDGTPQATLIGSARQKTS